ncbi:MAG TPA: DUF4190 domain-containing protein [Mycobacteriales bacterium]|nr:DUF4190 domain-containing protein [Mycobacteriales bacterium]
MSDDTGATAPPQLSPDGHWWWTGSEWVPADQAPPQPMVAPVVVSEPEPVVLPEPEPVAMPEPAVVPEPEPDPEPDPEAEAEPKTVVAAEPFVAWGPPAGTADPSWAGAPPTAGWEPAAVVSGPRNRLAVASLLLALLWLFGVGALLAIVLGVLALRQIAASGDAQGDAQGGRGFARAGIVLGALGLVGALGAAALVPRALDNRRERDRIDVRQNLHSAAVAQEAHRISEGTYTDSMSVLVAEGYVPENDVALRIVRATDTEYCLTASKGGEHVTYLSSASAGTSTQPC